MSYPPRAFDDGDTDSNYPSPGGPSKDDKKDKGDKDKRGVINRVNRTFLAPGANVILTLPSPLLAVSIRITGACVSHVPPSWDGVRASSRETPLARVQTQHEPALHTPQDHS